MEVWNNCHTLINVGKVSKTSMGNIEVIAPWETGFRWPFSSSELFDVGYWRDICRIYPHWSKWMKMDPYYLGRLLDFYKLPHPPLDKETYDVYVQQIKCILT